MRLIILISVLIIGTDNLFAQKQPLDHSVYDIWQQIAEQQISNDGRFVAYSIYPGPLVIQATDQSYKKNVVGGSNPVITEDSRFVIFNVMSDSLVILEPGKDKIISIGQVQSYKTPRKGNGQWLAYQVNKPEDNGEGSNTELVLQNLHTGKQTRYSSVTDYYFSAEGNILVTRTKSSTSPSMILWIDLTNTKTDTIMHGFKDARKFVFDETGNQLAFITDRNNVKNIDKMYTLWYYKSGMDSAYQITNNIISDTNLRISNTAILNFSKNGKKLFFGLSPVPPVKKNINGVPPVEVDIWHYKDVQLQSHQSAELNLPINYPFVIDLETNKIVQLGNKETQTINIINGGNSDYVLETTNGSFTDLLGRITPLQTAYLISTKDGSRRLVEKEKHRFTVSPSGKFVIWYDSEIKQYSTYNIEKNNINTISSKIPVPLYDDEYDLPDFPKPFGIGGWMENDGSVLIYDRYDIWKVDPDAIDPPISITKSYGKRNKIVLRYVKTNRDDSFIKPDEVILLNGFNRVNKQSGFFKKQVNRAGDAIQLTMGPYSYDVPPQKAKNAELYLVRRMSFSESEDIYVTTGFKSFTNLSQINPQQKKYNWLTAELKTWQMFDGKEAEGILYKPENFDSSKKYPVIFYVYEKLADNLFNYIKPEATGNIINISYFVSNGYLVFTPNIYYKIGEPGESVYNSVVSAAEYLSKMPWVDSTKMGIQGHSFGGYEVAYLVTRTNLFAAAVACAAVTNFVSGYGSLRDDGRNNQYLYEVGQNRIGSTLWKKPELYIKNSPVFNADKVTTPLLLMHNKGDGAVPWPQAVEYFNALGRLGKKVWMLQYDGERHSISGSENQKDFTIRLAQFFDYYLKEMAPAKWITEGVPMRMKGIDPGLEMTK